MSNEASEAAGPSVAPASEAPAAPAAPQEPAKARGLSTASRREQLMLKQRNTPILPGACNNIHKRLATWRYHTFLNVNFIYFIDIRIFVSTFELSCHWRLAKPALIQMSTQRKPRRPERPQPREHCRHRWLLQGSLVMRWQRAALKMLPVFLPHFTYDSYGCDMHWWLQGVDVAASNVAPTTPPQKAEFGKNCTLRSMWRYVSLWVLPSFLGHRKPNLATDWRWK